MGGRKIDIYNHVMPRAVADHMRELAPGKGDMVKRVTSIPMLHDIEARIRMMEEWPGYQQVLTLSNPPLETIAGPGDSPALARLANDELHRICAARPDKFPAWVASLPLNNVEASLAEIDRAVAAGARGIQIFTNVDGRPLDDLEFFPIFEHATTRHHLAIWMHPARDARFADYRGEQKSKYEIWQVLGWPYETSVAMARIVFSGMFDRLPELRLVTHHLGAMIPYFEGRVGPLWDQLGSRTSDEDYTPILAAMTAKGSAPDRLFPPVLQRHGGRRRGFGDPLRPRFFRRRSRAVRHRLPVRPRRRSDVHPRHHRCDRRPRPRRGGAARNSTLATL